jgi:hypothetical protein
MSILGKMVSTLTKVVGGTKNKKDKFTEESNRDFWGSQENRIDDFEDVMKERMEEGEKNYLNLLCLSKGRHQALETDVSAELIKPIKQSRHWKFGGSYCINATQLAELKQFFVDNHDQILKNSKASMKIFREKFADYEVDNPNMEKEV